MVTSSTKTLRRGRLLWGPHSRMYRLSRRARLGEARQSLLIMKYQQVNINTLLGAEWCFFTSNEGVKANGENVMGRGTAAEVRARFPEVAARYGSFLRSGDRGIWTSTTLKVGAFPVKPSLVVVNRDKSNIVPHMRSRVTPGSLQQGWMSMGSYDLIRKSWNQLVDMAESDCFGNRPIYLPNPGTGNAGLDGKKVNGILNERPCSHVIIIHL